MGGGGGAAVGLICASLSVLDGCVFKQECVARKLRKVSVCVCFMSSIAHLKCTCVDMRVCRKLLFISLEFTLLVKQNLTDGLQQE